VTTVRIGQQREDKKKKVTLGAYGHGREKIGKIIFSTREGGEGRKKKRTRTDRKNVEIEESESGEFSNEGEGMEGIARQSRRDNSNGEA